VISASALALMLVSRYAVLGSFGPFPDSYDPVWFPEKLRAAFGEAGAGAASLAGFLLLLIRPGLRAAGAAPGAPVIVTADFRPAGEHSRRRRRINLGPAI
jgi:hypothetical protein